MKKIDKEEKIGITMIVCTILTLVFLFTSFQLEKFSIGSFLFQGLAFLCLFYIWYNLRLLGKEIMEKRR